jgi:hypothetical protein
MGAMKHEKWIWIIGGLVVLYYLYNQGVLSQSSAGSSS